MLIERFSKSLRVPKDLETDWQFNRRVMNVSYGEASWVLLEKSTRIEIIPNIQNNLWFLGWVIRQI